MKIGKPDLVKVAACRFLLFFFFQLFLYSFSS